ncbi:hypothetical protein HCJ66_14965 [Listeria sp. FSL L7-1582]|uniref:hypothetical protein n=1 Tax=Listeria portnoyi TaxID=2713504 RepID=UPI00164DB3B7|nr:hypothetical protein [Listeria portnoyi]MBC6310839.1 hypothetical protein [Listeria portnoyi]
MHNITKTVSYGTVIFYVKNGVNGMLEIGDTIQLIEKVEDMQLEVYGYYEVFDIMFDGALIYILDGFGVYKVPSDAIQAI